MSTLGGPIALRDYNNVTPIALRDYNKVTQLVPIEGNVTNARLSKRRQHYNANPTMHEDEARGEEKVIRD